MWCLKEEGRCRWRKRVRFRVSGGGEPKDMAMRRVRRMKEKLRVSVWTLSAGFMWITVMKKKTR